MSVQLALTNFFCDAWFHFSYFINIFSECLISLTLADVCCYRGVCPTADRCNACIAGLTSGTLNHISRLLCMKFWGDRCHGRHRSACHAFQPNEIFYTTKPDPSRFNCFRRSDSNRNCQVSEIDPNSCHCEDNKSLSERFDQELSGRHYGYSKKDLACRDLFLLGENTRVKLHPYLTGYCDRRFYVDHVLDWWSQISFDVKWGQSKFDQSPSVHFAKSYH